MQVSLRDIYILLECARHVLRIRNLAIGIERENIVEAIDRIVNAMVDVKLMVELP